MQLQEAINTLSPKERKIVLKEIGKIRKSLEKLELQFKKSIAVVEDLKLSS